MDGEKVSRNGEAKDSKKKRQEGRTKGQRLCRNAEGEPPTILDTGRGEEREGKEGCTT